MVTKQEFRLFQALVYREAGIALSDQKQALLAGRLASRLRALELPSFSAYYDRVSEDEAELVRMIDCICTNETQFFREPKQFAFLRNELIPAWRAEAEASLRSKQLRIWSAACSTGEEPYSIAMSLRDGMPDWSIDIVATDLSTKALQRAASGVWSIDRARQIPEQYRRLFMLRGRGPQEGWMAAKPELSSMIRFVRLNLHHEPWPLEGSFDLIFCRNVLIYFDGPSKKRVVNRLLERLSPQGLLFLGHAESLSDNARVRSCGPNIYAVREPK